MRSHSGHTTGPSATASVFACSCKRSPFAKGDLLQEQLLCASEAAPRGLISIVLGKCGREGVVRRSVRWSWTLPGCCCGSEQACQGEAAGWGCRGGILFACAGITPVFKALGGCWPARKPRVTPTRSATPVSCCSVPARDSVLINPGLCHSIGGAAGVGGATMLERAAATDAAICTSKS